MVLGQSTVIFRYFRHHFASKFSTSIGSLKKQESSKNTSISALLTMPKPLTLWISLPGESHGQRSLVGCNPWGRYKWDMTERLI